MVKAVTEDTYSDGEINLLDYLIVLAKYGRLIVFVSAAITIITYLCLFLSPNLYTSTARILPPGQNMTLSAQVLNSLGGVGIPGASASQGIGGMAAGLLGLESPAELYVGIMTGDTVFDRIIERFHLQKRYHLKYIQNARDHLARMVDISVGKKDNLISIAVTDTDPKRAAEMANAFVGELDKLLRNLTAQEARNRLAFLEKERVRVNHNLTQAENVLSNFSVQKGVIQIDAQAKGILEYIANLRAQIDAREVQVEVLRKQATPYNYDVVRLETEIKGLKDKLTAAEKQYDPNCVGDVCLPTSKVPTLGLEYMRLYREVKFQEALYQLYTQLVEVARLDIARSFPTIQVVDRALPPEQRSNRRLLPAVLAGILACFMMVLVAFGLEHWQNTLQSAEEEKRKKQLMKYIQQWQFEGNRFLNFFKKKP
jgi:tyrosine-protein kinase Etk/Wzc